LIPDFDVEGQHLGLVVHDGLQAVTNLDPYWLESNIEMEPAELPAAGGTVKEAVREVSVGRPVVTATDSDGNELGILQDR